MGFKIFTLVNYFLPYRISKDFIISVLAAPTTVTLSIDFLFYASVYPVLDFVPVQKKSQLFKINTKTQYSILLLDKSKKCRKQLDIFQEQNFQDK